MKSDLSLRVPHARRRWAPAAWILAVLLASPPACEQGGGGGDPASGSSSVAGFPVIEAPPTYDRIMNEQLNFLVGVFHETPSVPILVQPQPTAVEDANGFCELEYYGKRYYGLTLLEPSRSTIMMCSPNSNVARHELMHTIFGYGQAGHPEFFNGIRVSDYVEGWSGAAGWCVTENR